MPKKKNKAAVKKMAQERIKSLFKQAELIFPTDKKLAHRYVHLARKIAMKARIRIPRELKRRFCKHCYSYLKPGKNARVRVHGGKVIIYCAECKKFTRIPFK